MAELSNALGASVAVTLWIALTDADAGGGCLRVLPGSHQGTAHELVAEPPNSSMFGVGIGRDVVDEGLAVSVEVTARAVVVHHANLIRGSRENRSPGRQIALGIRCRALREGEKAPGAITPLVGLSPIGAPEQS